MLLRDESLLKNLFETHKPAWVLHAAAHKHVALMEGTAPIYWRRPPRPTMWSCAAHQRDGGFEAPGRDGAALAFGEERYQVHVGAVRQCAGELRQRGEDLPGADTGRRAFGRLMRIALVTAGP